MYELVINVWSLDLMSLYMLSLGHAQVFMRSHDFCDLT
jgi:hypothetical protein